MTDRIQQSGSRIQDLGFRRSDNFAGEREPGDSVRETPAIWNTRKTMSTLQIEAERLFKSFPARKFFDSPWRLSPGALQANSGICATIIFTPIPQAENERTTPSTRICSGNR